MATTVLDGPPAALSAGPSPGGMVALLQHDKPRLHLFGLSTTAALTLLRSFTLDAPALMAAAAPFGGAGDMAVLSGSGDAVCLIATTGAEQRQCVSIDGRGERLLITDVDSDRRPDILVFGRSMSGVQVLAVNRQGTLIRGALLFPDLSVSDLQASDLNGDGITDLVLLRWLQEELVVLYGIGRGVFTRELSVPLPEEPRLLTLIPPVRRRSFGVVVSQPRSRSVAVYEGNTTGSFALRETIPVAGDIRSLHVIDVTGDRIRDLIIGSATTLAVAEGLSPFTFDLPVPLGLGKTLVGTLPVDLNGDGHVDLVTADADTRRLLVLGNMRGPTTPPTGVYAVGGSPAGVAVHDVTGDGLPDLLVANRETDNITVLRNDGNGVFRSQRSVAVAPRPEFLRFAETRAAGTLVVAHPSTANVSIVRLGRQGRDSAVTIGTGTEPFLLRAREAAVPGTIEALVRYSTTRDGTVSISLFEEIAGRRFIERSVRPTTPGRIVALAGGDLTRNGMYDVVFAARTRAKGALRLAAALSSEGFDLRTVREAMSIADSGMTGLWVFLARLDGDDFPDLLVQTHGDRPRMAYAIGRGDGSFADSLTTIAAGRPIHEAGVHVADADGDGRQDIVYIDAEDRTVAVLFQRTDGTFRPPAIVAHAPDAMTLGLAPLGGLSRPDLIIPHAAHGTVSITLDPFRR